jgi:4-diphosphocytidyl-2C-methyl-D-erythritol kinase
VQFGPNSLQDALFSAYPLAQDCFERVSQVSEGRATVSGSGPTIVAWFPPRMKHAEPRPGSKTIS